MAALQPNNNRMWSNISETSVNTAIAVVLTDIKAERDLTDLQLGLKVGRSADAAALYRKGESGMSAATLVASTVALGPAMANAAFGLAGYVLVKLDYASRTDALPVVSLLHKMMATSPDGRFSDRELLDMAAEVADAGAVIDTLRSRLADLQAGVR